MKELDRQLKQEKSSEMITANLKSKIKVNLDFSSKLKINLMSNVKANPVLKKLKLNPKILQLNIELKEITQIFLKISKEHSDASSKI